jgi:hypothetical protein
MEQPLTPAAEFGARYVIEDLVGRPEVRLPGREIDELFTAP